MNSVTHKFELGTLVLISDLNTEGVVESVHKHINDTLPSYGIRYINAADMRVTERFVEYELEPIEEE